MSLSTASEALLLLHTLDAPAARRRLLLMLIASAVVHLVAIVSMHPWQPPTAPKPTLHVALRVPVTTPAAPAAYAPSRQPAVPARSSAATPLPSARAAAKPAAAPLPSTAPTASDRPAESSLATAAPEPTPAAAPAPVAAAPAAATPDPAVAAETLKARLDRYGQIAAAAVSTHRQYPGIARLRGWQGTTLLEVRVGQRGDILSSRISRSSGHPILDEQALAMLHKASPLPALPWSSPEQFVVFSLPVTFTLLN